MSSILHCSVVYIFWFFVITEPVPEFSDNLFFEHLYEVALACVAETISLAQKTIFIFARVFFSLKGHLFWNLFSFTTAGCITVTPHYNDSICTEYLMSRLMCKKGRVLFLFPH